METNDPVDPYLASGHCRQERLPGALVFGVPGHRQVHWDRTAVDHTPFLETGKGGLTAAAARRFRVLSVKKKVATIDRL